MSTNNSADNVLFYATLTELGRALDQFTDQYSKVILLCDENTLDACFVPLAENCPKLHSSEIIVVEPGEESKSLEIAQHILLQLLDSKADKKAVLINLGGGMITDLGGWVASNYKRGIACIHIPTSLLAMVDASIGGKNGLNLDEHKNIIGLTRFATSTMVCPEFLNSLNENEIRNGRSEMVKHALLASAESYFKCLQATEDLEEISLDEVIGSATVKLQVTSIDPFEQGLRKTLNFGHSIGHAFESYFMSTAEPMDHGIAVAAGMAVELLIAEVKSLTDNLPTQTIVDDLIRAFDLSSWDWPSWEEISGFLLNDKKNESGDIKMALLLDYGHCNPEVKVASSEIERALGLYGERVLHSRTDSID